MFGRKKSSLDRAADAVNSFANDPKTKAVCTVVSAVMAAISIGRQVNEAVRSHRARTAYANASSEQ